MSGSRRYPVRHGKDASEFAVSALRVLQGCGVATTIVGFAYILVTEGTAATVIGSGQMAAGAAMFISARLQERQRNG